jgi:hypothetical protein
VVAILAGWVASLAIGWALVYWPYLPERFLSQTGLDPQAQNGFPDALYLSLVTVSTLGYGDIVPTAGLFRMLAPLETLMGFGLLTAGLTWVLSIYPALTRRRSLAQQAAVLRDAESQSGIDVVEAHPETAEQVFRDLVAQVLIVRGDFQQFYVTYFFHSADERSSLAAALPYLACLAESGADPDHPRGCGWAPPCCGAHSTTSQPRSAPAFSVSARRQPRRCWRPTPAITSGGRSVSGSRTATWSRRLTGLSSALASPRVVRPTTC